ncbi:hypothetical protein DCO58_11745 [Helicobacter saguini]|uniref:Uncharacterized protein n=1 Tax=Helicobacter saguini TaxID=1548018 RepID=A0A347VQ85_9HELI|nr:hypothetical protein [Helicobacter saguini]MWV61037.1 hypothetical protein [Helicobacter saguini]MWV68294.1 hypothetical protein [Helicobacter saguini]MWV70241.1 hypothetical protein [Helicobacter saguini]MWV72144.1 hypothetical protein [Helicobacter saguini]TLD95206.1 hypothetical protein LS64_002245 [Helicobacter saguini]
MIKKKYVKYLDNDAVRSYIECVSKINSLLKDFSEEQIDEIETAFYGKHTSTDEIYSLFLNSKPLFPNEMANKMTDFAEFMAYLDEKAKDKE